MACPTALSAPFGCGESPSFGYREDPLPLRNCVLFTCCFFIWQNGRMAVWLKFCPPVRGVTDSCCASHSAADCFAVGKRLLASPWLGIGRWAEDLCVIVLGLDTNFPSSTYFPTSPNLIFINCHSHNPVTGTFYIVHWDWVLLVLREPRVPL